MPVLGAQSVIGEAPLTSAHEHAQLADDLHVIGDYARAVEEHRKAAAEYLNSVNYVSDPVLQETLRRMHMDQVKAVEEIERRIAQMERDSSRKRAVPKPSYGYLTPNDRSPSRTPLHSPRSSTRRLQESMMSDRTSGSDSFLFLPADSGDPADRFTRFWNTVEAKLDQLSQPVAFTSLPLGDDSASTDAEEEASVSAVRGTRSTVGPGKGKGKAKASSAEPRVIELNFEADDSSDSDSFYLIPSYTPPSRSVTTSGTLTSEKRLQEENEKLRKELEQMKDRMVKAETTLKIKVGQEVQLRESIMLAKREAQRTLLQSTTLRHPGVNPLAYSVAGANIPPILEMPTPHTPLIPGIPGRSSPAPPGALPTNVVTLQKRVKDLEDEVRRLKGDNTKLLTQNARFKEKWQSLKESAKKRRTQKEAQAMAEGLKAMSIKEEDEEDLQNSGTNKTTNDTNTTA